MKHDFTPQLQRDLDPQTSAAISQGIDNLSSYAAAANSNRKRRKWAEKMYNQEKEDKLANWNRENEYNSPKKQMERLKAAGLNPNLVYGHGADATAGQIASTSSGTPDVETAPIGNTAMTYMNVQMMNAQLQNVIAQNDLIKAQTENVRAGTLNRGADTALKSFRHRFNLKTEGIDIEQKEATLHGTNTQSAKVINEIALSRNRDYREAILNASTVKEATARVAEIYARINNLMPAQVNEINTRIAKMEKEGRLLDYEADLNSAGVQKNDSFLFRIMARIMDAIISGTY